MLQFENFVIEAIKLYIFEWVTELVVILLSHSIYIS